MWIEPDGKEEKIKTVYILAAVIAVLAVTVAVIVYVSLVTRAKYKRKLQAATVKPHGKFPRDASRVQA